GSLLDKLRGAPKERSVGRPLVRLLVGGGAAILLLIAVAYLSSNGPDPGAADEGGEPSFWDEAQQEQIRREELDARLADAVRRAEVTVATVEGVIAGRLTLREAAARYRALARGNPDFPWETFHRTYAGASEEERFCRQVIDAVQKELRDQPDEAARVVARLVAELEELLERDGIIRLPDL